MTQTAALGAHGVLTDPSTLTIERLLPGTPERVWAYLTESDLRRQWLASGDMTLAVGAPFELTWHHDKLTTPPGERPDGVPTEHSMASEVTECDPPRKLGFTWGKSDGVTIELEPQGDCVLLKLVHRHLPDPGSVLSVSAGWHAHLDVLVARMSGQEPKPFWDDWKQRRGEYEQRILA